MRLLQEVTTGYVTFAYKTYLPNNFAKISNIYYEDVPAV
jgi:hypothetical protein